jgi:hypothetical protein
VTDIYKVELEEEVMKVYKEAEELPVLIKLEAIEVEMKALLKGNEEALMTE